MSVEPYRRSFGKRKKEKKKETSAVKYNTSSHYRGRRYKNTSYTKHKSICTVTWAGDDSDACSSAVRGVILSSSRRCYSMELVDCSWTASQPPYTTDQWRWWRDTQLGWVGFDLQSVVHLNIASVDDVQRQLKWLAFSASDRWPRRILARDIVQCYRTTYITISPAFTDWSVCLAQLVHSFLSHSEVVAIPVSTVSLRTI